MKYDSPFSYTPITPVEGDDPFFTTTIEGDYEVVAELGVVWSASTDSDVVDDSEIYERGGFIANPKPLSGVEAEWLAERLRGGPQIPKDPATEALEILTVKTGEDPKNETSHRNPAADSLAAMLNLMKFNK